MNKSPGNKRSQIDSIRFPIQTGGSFQGQYSKLLSNDNTDRKQKNLKDEFKDNDPLYDKSVKTIMKKNDGTVYHADDSCGKKDHTHTCLERTKCSENCFRSGPIACNGDNFNTNLDTLNRYHKCWQERRATIALCNICGPNNTRQPTKDQCPGKVKSFCSTYDMTRHQAEVNRSQKNFEDCRNQLDEKILENDSQELDVIEGRSYVFVLGDGTTRRKHDVFCTVPCLQDGSSFAYVIRRITPQCDKKYHKLMFDIIENTLNLIRKQTNHALETCDRSIKACVEKMVKTTLDSNIKLKSLTERTSASIDAEHPIPDETLRTLLTNMTTELSKVVKSLADCVEKSIGEVKQTYKPENANVKELRELEQLLVQVLLYVATQDDIDFDALMTVLQNESYKRWIDRQITGLPNARATYRQLSLSPKKNIDIFASFARTTYFGVDAYGTVRYLNDYNY
jgi:hypothetical protein